MPARAVIGFYDSLAKAEEAEFRLEEAQLPVGQLSLIAPKEEAGELEGDITESEVADAVADTGLRLAKAQVDAYERLLKEGKHLLIFTGDVDQVARAYQALGHTDNDQLTILGG